MLDGHSHILYGMDDGAKDFDESIAMLIAAKAAGVTGIIATPHVNDAHFNFSLAQKRKEELTEYANHFGIRLLLGSEVHWQALSELLLGDNLTQYCTEGTNEILIDFNLRGDLPKDMIKKIFALQRQGLKVIIAHPERYLCVQKEILVAKEWLNMGCSLQLDANVLLLSAFDNSKRSAIAMLKQGMYQSFASDAHCSRDYECFLKSAVRANRRVSA